MIHGNGLYYQIGLNRYVSNLLYMHFLTDDKAEEFFKTFEQLMRSLDLTLLESLFEPLAPTGERSPVREILTFCICQRKHISEEIDGLRDQRRNWVLELSLSALMELLSTWAEKHDELEIVCDDSEPLKDTVDMFTGWVGTKRRSVTLPGLNATMHFPNLAKPVRFARSEDEPGIQLADVLASAFAQAAKRGPSDKTTLKWGEALMPSLAGAIMPDLDEVDMRRPKAKVLLAVLLELVRRAVKGEHLCNDMDKFLVVATRDLHRIGAGR